MARKTATVQKRDAAATRQHILEIALAEFAQQGLSGARIDEIAAKTRTSKRMLYYYFGDKEGLFIAVLEKAYGDMRAREAALTLDSDDPVTALAELVRFTFDHHAAHPEFIRLVMTENIHDARHIRNSSRILDINRTAIEKLQNIHARGVATGQFSPEVTALELHWNISALAFFHVSNQPTFSVLFEEPFGAFDQKKLRELCVKAVLGAASGKVSASAAAR